MTELPSAVIARLANRLPQEPTISSLHVGRGDLRIVDALSHEPAASRLALVLSVDPTHEFADVLLVHTATELATEADVVIEKDLAGTPYDVVVQTDLRAVVWTFQTGKAVGHLGDETLSSIKLIASPASNDTTHAAAVGTMGVRYGLPLAGPSDRRWDFKVEEGEALRALAKDCTGALLEHGTVWRVDVGLLQPELVEENSNPDGLLCELLHWLRTRDVDISEADLDILESRGARRPEDWNSIEDLGLDVWTTLEDLIVGAATRARSEDAQAYLSANHLYHDDEPVDADIVHLIGSEPVAS